jgi:hypothetical protein
MDVDVGTEIQFGGHAAILNYATVGG